MQLLKYTMVAEDTPAANQSWFSKLDSDPTTLQKSSLNAVIMAGVLFRTVIADEHPSPSGSQSSKTTDVQELLYL